MSFFKQLFTKQAILPSSQDEPFLPQQLCESINQVVMTVFRQYYSQLVDKSAVYIVQAVWGEEIYKVTPTPLQIEIHNRIETFFSYVNDKIKPATNEQALINVFLIRELIIAKLNFMISESKRILIEKHGISMLEIETIGCA